MSSQPESSLPWRNVFGDAAADVTPSRREVERIVQSRDAARSGDPEDLGATVRKLVHTGLFTIDETHRYRWTIEMTTDQVRELFRTFSDWTADEAEEASLVVAALGGTVSEAYTSWLITACRFSLEMAEDVGIPRQLATVSVYDSTRNGVFLDHRRSKRAEHQTRIALSFPHDRGLRAQVEVPQPVSEP